MRMEYLDAEDTLCRAEVIAREQRDFDTLGRLYMPLQETRRQRRQRCGEGIVCLDLIAQDAADRIDGKRIIENYPHGQLLVAGWGSIEPALKIRELQKTHKLYVEIFLAAAYPVGDARAIAIVPTDGVKLPDPIPRGIDELLKLLPPNSIVFHENVLPKGPQKGTWQTYARVSEMWERLHAPFLAQADMMHDLVQKIEGHRKTIAVDYACELAHQKLADVARQIARSRQSTSC
jgi:hypothetical protein